MQSNSNLTGIVDTLENIPRSNEHILEHVSSENGKGKIYFKDSSKPDGDACNDDSTLKDASELEWPDSPSENKTTSNSDPIDSDHDFALDSEHLDQLNEEVSPFL